MSAHLKALLGVVIVGGILGAVFFSLYKPVPQQEGPSLSLIEKMKTEGVPAIQGASLDGAVLDLEKFKGKVIIVNFWASWCEPCIEEVPSLVSLVEKMKGDVVLVAISGDSNKADIDSFAKAFPGLKKDNIHLMWDEKKKIVEEYGVERLPETFIVGPDLKLIKKVVGSINWDHQDSIEYFKNIQSSYK